MSEHEELPPGSSESDIAIVGLAGRFPGARDIEEFWTNLRNGVESATWLTDEQLRAAGVPEELIADPNYVRACYPMPEMDGFDAKFFGFAPSEAAIMDPQQRHFLELAWTAMEHAGHAPERFAGSVGVFAGCGASTYLMFNLLTNPELVENVGFFLLRHTGNDKDFLATRASYLMNLKGPSVNVQTACSTSLVAIHMGVQSLLNHECDMALAGGSTVKQPHQVGYLYKEGEIMAPDGHCRAFDEKAEGTVFGSGSGVVVLRRLADAIRDGDTIHAVIKGSAINNDGAQKVGFLAPSVDGQAQAITEALGLSGVDPSSIQYVECHGTATPVGDPIEITALAQAFRAAGAEGDQFCAIGSLKSNVGHLDTAAGVAAVIKTVQALKHGEIPASLHYTAPNPSIDFESSPFFVNNALRKWTTDGGPRRAGVSSLGAGGTNAHVILEEAPELKPSGDSRAWQPYVLSAKTPTALDAQSAALAQHLKGTSQSAADIAFTLANGRQGMSHRRFVVADSAERAAQLLAANDPKLVPTGKVSDKKRSLAFMFAGGGAQHPGMGADLYATEPVYRAAVDDCVALLQPKLDWDIKRLLLAVPADRSALAAELERPSRSLPCLFITQYAMAKLCESWGLVPDAMIGHSMGEYTAAHLAGVFSLADGLALVSLRGQLFEKVAPGGMLSVPLPAQELAKRITPDLSIAAENAPELSVASGPVAALDALEKALAADDIDCRRIHINIAAHSSMLEPILAEFGAFFRGVKLSAPHKPFVSNVTGTWIRPEEAMSGEYWVRHLRNMVRFADGVAALLEDEGRLFLEVGPGRTLTTLAGLHGARKPEQVAISSMRHPDEAVSDVAHAVGMLGRLWLNGLAVDWSKLWGGERRRRVPLPTYPFEHQSYYIQPGKVRAAKPSLARKADIGEWFWSPSWTRTPLAGEVLPPAAHTLVFCDEQGISRTIAARLGEAGRVTSVMPGRQFEKKGDHAYSVNPGDLAQLQQLAAELAKDSFPTQIVHAWNLGGADASTEDIEARAFYSLLGFLQGIAAEGVEEPLRLTVLTAGAQRVGGEAALEPRRALVMGPVRVAGKELPNVTARTVDVALSASPNVESRIVAQLLRELQINDDATVVALRGGDRYVQGFAPLPLPAAATASSWLRDGATVLITGGLGGLGLLTAGELARSAKGVKLALMGRGVAKDQNALRELEAAGAQVMTVQADVSDAAQVAAAVQQVRARFGAITHLVHAAGVVEDALIPMTERDSAARVLAPKVRGTLALEDALRGDALERVLLFSSRGAVAGVAGQVDYTAASAFLDAWAERQSSLGGVDVLSIDWSAWQGVGLAAALAAGASHAPQGREAKHSLLGRCINETADETVYQASLGIDSHWLLDGHRIRGGEALIPGTGYLEIIRAAAEERAAMGRLEIRDVFFISPFVVQGSEQREMRVTLEGTRERDIVIEGRAAGASGGQWDEHARAVVLPLEGEAPAKQDPAAIRARCSAQHVTFTGNETREHLVLGKRWSNISALDYGNGEAIATLKLPAEFASETEAFRLHPALLDVATACAQALIPGYDPKRDFYIPVSYGRVRVWATLAGECYSHIKLQPRVEEGQDTAVYDVNLIAPNGDVLVEISDFTMMLVKDRVKVGNDAAKGGAPAALRDAIKPAEGLDAFRRMVSAGIAGQVIVSPQDLRAYLASLAEAAAPAPAEPKPAPEPPPVDVSQIEAVLAAHEAIHQVVVTAHRERTGGIRITAFVVFALGEQATISELRRFLRGKLPDDMVPQHLVELEQLPLGKDGKVDRAALPDPFAGQDDFVGPRSEMESTIAKIWIELLGVNRVSVYDNFLDVGGHSLLAMRAVSRIAKATGVRLNPSVMTLHTLEQIAAECAEKSAAGAGR